MNTIEPRGLVVFLFNNKISRKGVASMLSALKADKIYMVFERWKLYRVNEKVKKSR